LHCHCRTAPEATRTGGPPAPGQPKEASITQPGPDAAPPEARLGRRVAIASLFAVLQRLLMRGLGLFSTLILVRLLAPEDFGIVGLASAVLTTLEMLTSTGFGLALIRMREPTRAHYDTVFTLTLARGLLLAVAMLATAGWQADFMGDARIRGVMWAIAGGVIALSLESPRLIDLQRSLKFDRLLSYHVAHKVLAIAISLPIAFWLRNYWALVLASPISRLLVLPLSYWLAPYRPRLSLAAWRDLFSFSKWLFLGNIAGLIDSQAMVFIVGRTQGIAAVGLYQVAFQIAALPISEIAAPIRQPIYAGFARVWHDLTALRRQFLDGLSMQGLVILPLSVGVALCAHEVTLLFLGERWLTMAPLMPLVALFALFDGIGHYTGNVFLALNRQALFVATAFAAVALRIAATAYGAVEHGLAGAAWAMLATSVLNAVVWQALASRLMRLSAADLARAVWRPCLAAAAMAAAVLALPADPAARLGVAAAWPVATALLAKTLTGAVVFCAAVVALWKLSGAPSDSAEATLLRGAAAALVRFARARNPRRTGSTGE
jgi:lipopolysaccharide exporter